MYVLSEAARRRISQNLSKLFICFLHCIKLYIYFCLSQDVDDFFEHEKTFLLEYHNRVKDASAKSDRMIRSHKSKFLFSTHIYRCTVQCQGYSNVKVLQSQEECVIEINVNQYFCQQHFRCMLRNLFQCIVSLKVYLIKYFFKLSNPETDIQCQIYELLMRPYHVSSCVDIDVSLF